MAQITSVHNALQPAGILVISLPRRPVYNSKSSLMIESDSCTECICDFMLEPHELLYTPYILRGFYFREFRESGAIREFNNTRK